VCMPVPLRFLPIRSTTSTSTSSTGRQRHPSARRLQQRRLTLEKPAGSHRLDDGRLVVGVPDDRQPKQPARMPGMGQVSAASRSLPVSREGSTHGQTSPRALVAWNSTAPARLLPSTDAGARWWPVARPRTPGARPLRSSALSRRRRPRQEGERSSTRRGEASGSGCRAP
jgi:hypothetical protein